MKIRYITALIMILVFSQAYSQQFGMRRGGWDFNERLDLTEEQEEQIEKIWIETQKETTPLRSRLNTLSAELDELLIADTPNQGAIDKKIEEMTEWRAQLHKSRIHTRLKIRELLTDEQRIKFDSMRLHRRGRGGRFGGYRSGRLGRELRGRQMLHRWLGWDDANDDTEI